MVLIKQDFKFQNIYVLLFYYITVKNISNKDWCQNIKIALNNWNKFLLKSDKFLC